MGYVTAVQLSDKYGSYIAAAKAFLTEEMWDADERDAVRQRLAPLQVVVASHQLLMAKLLEIEKILRREEG
jgi:hypothetical protein